jgi:hypothetical protein
MKMPILVYRLLDLARAFIGGQATRSLLATGAALVAIGAAGDRFVEVVGPSYQLKLSLLDPAGPITTWVIGIGIFLIVLGVGTGLASWWQMYKAGSRTRLVVVEIRGLRQTADTPITSMRGLKSTGSVDLVLLDIRQNVADGVIVDEAAALRDVVVLPLQLKALRAGLNRNDVQVVVGGLAPVPLLFTVGALLDDESSIKLVDWDREKDEWRELDGPDDGERFNISETGKPDSRCEAVVAVSVSYLVDMEAVNTTFPNHPVVHLRVPKPQIGNHWSEAKQRELTTQFLQTMASLVGRGVRTVHVVAAVPASLAIRLGRACDRRNMPEPIVYQYERNLKPPYPWAVHLPTAPAPPMILRGARKAEQANDAVAPATHVSAP